MARRVVLAYSGGLDTSVAVRWMIEELGVEVIRLAADVGQGGDFDVIKERAMAAGAVEALVVDCREEFAYHFVAPALRANAKYEGKYPLISSLSRPIIARIWWPRPGNTEPTPSPTAAPARATTRCASRCPPWRWRPTWRPSPRPGCGT